MSSVAVNEELESPLEPDPSVRGLSSAHIPALDGIRGLAVLLVMMFHCAIRVGGQFGIESIGNRVARTGWVGVDIFFVLSGFLITGILIDTKETKKFFRNFYMRRVLRILPVYYFVLIIVLIILPIFISYKDPGLEKIVDRQSWLWLHLSNVGFVYYRKAWLSAGWLDLSHLWSLAVEEQFYLIWPLLVWLLPTKKLPLLCMMGIIIPIFFRLGLWWAGQSAGAMYFATPCRIDGLALGALVAVAIRRPHFSVSRRLIGGVALTGGLGLLILVLARGDLSFIDKATVAFAPIFVNLITAAAILSVLHSRGIVSRVFEGSALRFSGRYSYGLYLFHPLIAAPLSIAMLNPAPQYSARDYLWAFAYIIGMFVLSFVAAFLSFHGFEKYWLSFKTRFHAVPGRVGARQPHLLGDQSPA